MNYYNQIKQELISNEIYKKVKDYSKNKNDLMTYYNVGKLLIEAQGDKKNQYGNNIIKLYSKKLQKEVNKKYSETNLKYMRQFYKFCESGHALRDNLSWTHYRTLLPLQDDNEIEYYIEIASLQNLSYRKLEEKIKSQEYERLPNKTKNKLIVERNNKIEDFIKNPIIINNNSNNEIISEKVLQQLILEDLPNFLKELGSGYSFIDNEYPIKIGNNYNYIDLLLFNIKYNCYVVIELKITPLKKEHIGQIEVYMNYINQNIKQNNHNKTIGIIISKEDNEYIIKYCSDPRILSTTYLIK